MNKFFSKIVVVFFFIAFVAAPAQAGNWYSSTDECRETAEGGRVVPYVPAVNAARSARVANTVGVSRAPLPQGGCMQMQVSDGNYHAIFVSQGTEMFWQNGRVIAHVRCGNPVRGDVMPVRTASAVTQGAPGRDGAQGPRGEQGPAGRDGEVRYIEGQVLQYDQATPTRMSDRARVEITNNTVNAARDVVVTKIVVGGLVKILKKPTPNNLPPTTVVHTTLNVTGNCNNVLGHTVNCTTQSDRVVQGPPGPAGPPGRDGVSPNPGSGTPEPGVSPPRFGAEPGVNPPRFGNEPGVGAPNVAQPPTGVLPVVMPEPGVGAPRFGDGGGSIQLPPPPPSTTEPSN